MNKQVGVDGDFYKAQNNDAIKNGNATCNLFVHILAVGHQIELMKGQQVWRAVKEHFAHIKQHRRFRDVIPTTFAFSADDACC